MRNWSARFALVVLFLASLVSSSRAQDGTAGVRISVVGSSFHVVTAEGVVLPQEALAGAVIVVSDGALRLELRIASVERDPKDPALVRYALTARDAESGEWRNICAPGPDGRARGFPLSGVFGADGRHVPAEGRFSLTCTSGAIGKCVQMGYKPWQSPALWAHHQACVRMVRADYCGDGVSHTRNGTQIDVWDRIGVQAPDRLADLSFEAAWSPEGAVCVARTRIPALGQPNDLQRRCPARLTGRIGPACTEHSAPSLGDALILNGS